MIWGLKLMKGWVIAMQISGYSSAAMLAYRSSGMKQKAGTVKMQDFSQMVQNTSAQATSQTDKTAATKEVSEVDEMAAFKQEIYEKLAEIDKMNSSAILSNSVHITEDGFKRMKEDPEYRKEIMDWLRADARASHGVPIAAHVTTTITGSGATSYGMNVLIMIVRRQKHPNSNGLIRKQKVRFIILIVPMLTVELHSVSGTASMWQVNAKSGNLCRR